MKNSGFSLELERFSVMDRRALVFARLYERLRRASGQYGYIAFRSYNSTILDKPIFKTFKTVVSWLDDLGWTTTWSEYHWQGYLKYVFGVMAPRMPMPGQLRNRVLLAEYIKQHTTDAVPTRSLSDLEHMYQNVVCPEIARQGQPMAILGLINLTDANTTTIA